MFDIFSHRQLSIYLEEVSGEVEVNACLLGWSLEKQEKWVIHPSLSQHYHINQCFENTFDKKEQNLLAAHLPQILTQRCVNALHAGVILVLSYLIERPFVSAPVARPFYWALLALFSHTADF